MTRQQQQEQAAPASDGHGLVDGTPALPDIDAPTHADSAASASPATAGSGANIGAAEASAARPEAAHGGTAAESDERVITYTE